MDELKLVDLAFRILSKAEILAAEDLPVEVVATPEWGGAVKVRGMSAEGRLQYVEKTRAADGSIDLEKATYYAVIYGVVEPQFTEADIPELKKRSAAVLDRISRVWLRLSGIGEEELLAARKNS